MQTVAEIMTVAARSQGRSLGYYWPADARGSNDLAENNLGFHVAHAFLQFGYAVFAEADHPDGTVQGVDLLAISENRRQFIAVELKRHLRAGFGDSEEDVERLLSFRLNHRLLEERCGSDPLRVLSECRAGIAIVAGLKWYGASRSPNLENDPAAQRIRDQGGEVIAELVYRYESAVAPGSYWLQYGFFSLQVD